MTRKVLHNMRVLYAAAFGFCRDLLFLFPPLSPLPISQPSSTFPSSAPSAVVPQSRPASKLRMAAAKRLELNPRVSV